MTPLQVALALGALVVFATVLGLVWKWQNGRARATDGGSTITAAELGRPLGRSATLLQFSSEVCAPCRATRRVLTSLADDAAGISHIDLDIVHHERLTRRFNVLQTPTTLVLDSAGVVRARIGGAVRHADVHALLARVTS